MNKYQVVIVYPIYLNIKALSQEKAEELALKYADKFLDRIGIEPIIQEIQQFDFLDETANIIQNKAD